MNLTGIGDVDELVKFLKEDYANNLYFFTYLPEITRGDPLVSVLVGRESGRMVLAALISPVHFCPAVRDETLVEAAARQLPVIESMHVLGKAGPVDKILGIIETPKRKREGYTLCRQNPDVAVVRDTGGCKKARYGDLSDLIDFYSANDMLIDCENRLPGILEWGTVYQVRREGRIVSAALTSTETEDAAMIGAVFTEPSCRGMGYSGACISALCRELEEKGRTAYLFYKSGDKLLEGMYGRLGFQAMDSWTVATRTDI